MYHSFVHLLLFGLSASFTALGHSNEPHYSALAKRSCDLRNVYFHYNDTSLGSMPSCSYDVLNIASRPITPARKRSFVPRQVCPPGQCSDGPITNVTVQAGDTLELIAARFNSGVCNIANASGIADNPDFLALGQALTVPTEVCDPDNTSCRKQPGTRPCIPQEENPPKEITIEAGDTFFLLGVKFNLTSNAFVAVNLCADPGDLEIGQKVKVPICPDCSDVC